MDAIKNLSGGDWIGIIIGTIILIGIMYVLYRWIFAIDKRVEQNDEIIRLLKKMTDTAEPKTISEKTLTPDQIELQRKYDNGEIYFNEYQKEWNKSSI